MNNITIGRLEEVELRDLWRHEEYDFSAWLALPENLELLSDEIGVSIINPFTERRVGSFSADIIAEDESGRKILIENQLEASNHDHLGKLFTYGSGLDAEVIVWIVKTARQEHEQAINWLNEHTDDRINIFLIEIEAWKIGDSVPAPRFNVIAKPNDWAKLVKQTSGERTLTDYKLLQQSFWQGLNDADTIGLLGQRKPRPRHWHDASMGSSKAHISLTINKTEKKVTCDLYIPRDSGKLIFDKLYNQKGAIEAETDMALEWMRLDDKLATRVRASYSADIEEIGAWPGYFEWLIDTAQLFRKVFGKRIR